MKYETNRKSIIQSFSDQLECDEFLGGKWMPAREAGNIVMPATENTIPQMEGNTPDMAKKKTNTKGSGPLTEKTKALGSLTRKIAKCKACPLHETRTNIVPGEGNANTRIVFVGEAPGQNEDEQGRPFVGRAGTLLENIINAMGLTRQDVFICNILKCRPPENRDPKPAEVAECTGFLHKQLAILEPDIIIALGAHAAKTLLETKTAIGQLRGKIHAYQPGEGAEPIKLIATYHPAYLLRNYTQDARLKVWDDMKRALKELGLPVPRKKKT